MLTVAIFVSMFAFPASAEDFDYDSRWIDLFDYNVSRNRNIALYSSTGSGTFVLDMPARMRLYHVDILAHFGSYAPDLLIRKPNGSEYLLTCSPLANGMYRYYGYIYAPNYDELIIIYRGNGSASSYAGSFINVKVSTTVKDSFVNVGSFALQYDSTSYSGTMSAYNKSLTWAGSVSDSTVYSLQLSCADWRKYDYIDFVISTDGMTIDSISGIHGDSGIDIKYDYVDSPYDGHTYMVLRMDVSGLSRYFEYDPYIEISGLVYDSFGVTLSGVTGHVEVETPDPYIYWLSEIHSILSDQFQSVADLLSSVNTNIVTMTDKLYSRLSTGFDSVTGWLYKVNVSLTDGFQSVVDKLDTLVNGTEEQQQAAEEFKNNSAEQSGQIDSAVDQMEVAKPDSGSIDTSVDTITGGMDFSIYNNALLTLTATPSVYQVLFIAVTLMTVSYVFFGKKV